MSQAPGSRQLFLDGPLYREVNSEAQKEFATDVAAPALTWHLAFLINQKTEGLLKCALDKKTIDLIKALKDSPLIVLKPGREKLQIFPDSLDHVILFDGIYDKSSIKKGVKERKVEEDICPFREVDLSKSLSKLVIISFHCHLGRCSIRIRLSANLLSITVLMERAQQILPLDKIGFARWTSEFWESDFLEQFILALEGQSGLFNHEIFENVFADIRGVIEKTDTTKADKWAEGMMPALEKLVTPEEGDECTANYLLGKRAILLTAMAPQSLKDGLRSYPLQPRSRRRRPLTFLLRVQDCVDAGELGRALDRMHLIATLRHAALLDLNLLRNASAELSRIDGSFKVARDALERFDSEHDFRAAWVRKPIEEAHRKLNNITNAFLESNAARVGLTFRVESSRTYWSQFKKNLSALRFRRIDGYRPYRFFVDRRLGAAFEAIDRLGTRYERATNALSEIDLRFSAIQSRRSGEVLAEIQIYGELLLLLVLVPYYALSSIHHLFEGDAPKENFWKFALVVVIMSFAISRFISASGRLRPRQKTILLATVITFDIAIAKLASQFRSAGVVFDEEFAFELSFLLALILFATFIFAKFTSLFRRYVNRLNYIESYRFSVKVFSVVCFSIILTYLFVAHDFTNLIYLFHQ